MESILQKINIEPYGNFIYEYQSINKDWWDSKYKTNIEVEIQTEADGSVGIDVAFTPDTEGIVERVRVFNVIYKGSALLSKALVAKKVYDNTNQSRKLPFSEEYNAYTIDSYAVAEEIFETITNLIDNKMPVSTLDLDMEIEDIENQEYEPGSTLGHFLVMLESNFDKITKKAVIEFVEMNKEIEGNQYVKELLEDISIEPAVDYSEIIELDKETINFVKQTLKEYLT